MVWMISFGIIQIFELIAALYWIKPLGRGIVAVHPNKVHHAAETQFKDK
ncbi:MAG: hypothetical protein K0R22_2936 [Sporomusa sp.]|jgi:hypothetical protein|nr:hypothetical protein [Sporomusa sp.]MDF2876253.1 hypothetical protein [Sporomusa sp.]